MTPLGHFAFRFRNFKSLSEECSEWLEFKPITILVGRNNAGKSSVIDAIEVALGGKAAFKDQFNRTGKRATIEIRNALTEHNLRAVFPENVYSPDIPAENHWEFGKQFAGSTIERSFTSDWSPTWVSGPDLSKAGNRQEDFRNKLVTGVSHPAGRVFRISAERNVVPEAKDIAVPVQSDGKYLTNLIRAFLYDSKYRMEEVEIELRGDLNRIYAGDMVVRRILCREDTEYNQWEIYLDTDGSPIRLSQSGSSLRSIFTILATVRLNHFVAAESSIDGNIFCVEEPENNLHPALLRRLLDFLAEFAIVKNINLIITTHSATAIDWGARRGDCNIYHVRRLNSGSVIEHAKEYRGLRSLLEDLDVRASEILQANGVIWVEGPSDRLYLRKWIELESEGNLLEGVHYSVMFYGGKLLSHLSSLPPNEVGEAISLLRLNKNLAIIMDSDRRRLSNGRFRASINATKSRLMEECKLIGGYVWVTQGKEIENYISSRLVQNFDSKIYDVDMYTSVPDVLQSMGDKISIAHKVAEYTDQDDLNVLDLKDHLGKLCQHIRKWNSL